ncbi:MAG: hypothetical protein RPR97_10410 [Colwellia sp.]
MEENKFFKWAARVNSLLFLVLLVISIGFVSFGILESNKWSARNEVEVTDKSGSSEEVEDLRLGDITKVCGSDIQYVKLNSSAKSRGFSSGGYGYTTRNVVFFEGVEMVSHWLFDTNSYSIREIDQLQKKADDCKDRETVAIYYEVRKEDADQNGKLDENDPLTIALTAPGGSNYTEIEVGITSVLDHSVDQSGSTLTLLIQDGELLLMKKYSLKTNEKISEREITRIGKKL